MSSAASTTIRLPAWPPIRRDVEDPHGKDMVASIGEGGLRRYSRNPLAWFVGAANIVLSRTERPSGRIAFRGLGVLE